MYRQWEDSNHPALRPKPLPREGRGSRLNTPLAASPAFGFEMRSSDACTLKYRWEFEESNLQTFFSLIPDAPIIARNAATTPPTLRSPVLSIFTHPAFAFPRCPAGGGRAKREPGNEKTFRYSERLFCHSEEHSDEESVFSFLTPASLSCRPQNIKTPFLTGRASAATSTAWPDSSTTANPQNNASSGTYCPTRIRLRIPARRHRIKKREWKHVLPLPPALRPSAESARWLRGTIYAHSFSGYSPVATSSRILSTTPCRSSA